ncbi:hypothetical protein AA12717_0860 [Gluconacetobacter sacchari DSM 12717]|uniref:Type II toxin-antitoxin system RelE/ParE family toxin n=2 Tax=Gluconacetobacter sacchari TaxID=92759 RepID=A0A7W4NQA9_9PROT|nr:type II toxin-antitoxin system RelE/ParE family toxin [Gluconacetobacter sacchari]MBB2162344.1 type II toxin-antitoxin system RelE/ParE family toxin [Gluconacetobacter sacchari]GBQ21359.1 hypothetical protein AA12717_0860 [Gluconacetobacter sacchari DSM 12717]
MIVRFTSDAEDDLEAIGDYIARDNPMRAVGFLRELKACCLELVSLPHAWPLVTRYASKGIRRRIYGDYVVFYHPGPAALTILRVLHGARDYAEIILDQ